MFNYHTHTVRCNHASGTDREYVENAIKAGMKVLGFADHAPYVFPNGYRSNFRMKDDQINEYAESVRQLKKEYANEIDILLGFELEYYPKFHSQEMDFLKTVNPDYLILSQHFIKNEIDGGTHIYVARQDILETYVSQIIEGLSTGDFDMVGHPDMVDFYSSNQAVQKEQFTRLCKYCLKNGYPLELNLLGIRAKRYYPSEDFFKVAGQVGSPVVIGYDAHDAQCLLETTQLLSAKRLIEKYNLNLITEPFIK